MAITPAQLLTLVNEICGRAETDLTQYLRNVIHDIEAESVFLEGETTFALVTGQDNYTISAAGLDLYRRPFHLQPLDASSVPENELIEKPYHWIRDYKQYTTGNGRPTHYAIWADTIYIWRKPSATYTTMKVWGYLYHSDTVTSISYPEKFRKLLVAGCAWYVFERYGLTDEQKAKDQKAIYNDQLLLQKTRKANERPHIAAYND